MQCKMITLPRGLSHQIPIKHVKGCRHKGEKCEKIQIGINTFATLQQMWHFDQRGRWTMNANWKRKRDQSAGRKKATCGLCCALIAASTRPLKGNKAIEWPLITRHTTERGMPHNFILCAHKNSGANQAKTHGLRTLGGTHRRNNRST